MRIRLKLKSAEEQLISYNYNSILNNLIYQITKDADPQLAHELFTEGIMVNDQPIKPFTFSRLLFENYRATRDGLVVTGDGEWLITSPLDELAEVFINGMIGRFQLKIGQNEFTVERHQMIKDPEIDNEIDCFMLGPVVTSIIRPDGREVFCHPLQSEFYDLLRDDLVFKVKQIYNITLAPQDIHFSIINPEKFDLERSANLIHYNGKNIKCYLFKVKITGPSQALKIAFNWGLGSFNYQGFGMIDFLK